nr:hypothetical protein [Tanacetum cinerariifolium]
MLSRSKCLTQQSVGHKCGYDAGFYSSSAMLCGERLRACVEPWALEERIGNVNIGLTKEKITKYLMLKQYVVETGCVVEPCCIGQVTGRVVEPCCICQEEYNDGDDLG